MKNYWCAKHRDGWCAAKSNRKWDEDTWSVPTVCNQFVIGPLGCKRGEPSCLECREILQQAEA